MVSAHDELTAETDTLDLHAICRERRAGRHVPFGEVDTFEGQPSDPTHLHKYLYAGANPVMNNDPSGHDFLGLGGLLTSIGIGGSLVGIGTPVLTGVLTARAGGSFWTGFVAGAPAGIAMSALAVESGGVLTPKFAYESFMVAYSTFFGVLIDEAVAFGKNAHGLDERGLADSIVKNLRNVALARAFKGGIAGFYNAEHSWIGPAVSSGSTLLLKSPDLVGDVSANIERWSKGQPTDWRKTENIAVDSILSGVQTYIFANDIGASGSSEFIKENLKILAFSGWKKIIESMFK